jgi:hypothetical protein
MMRTNARAFAPLCNRSLEDPLFLLAAGHEELPLLEYKYAFAGGLRSKLGQSLLALSPF